MKNLIAVFALFVALSIPAFAQENQVGAFLLYDRSDATVATNAVGGGAFVVKNFDVKGLKFTGINTFSAFTGQAFTVGDGRVLRNELEVRTFLPGFTTNIMGEPSTVYLSAMASVENQSAAGTSKTSFNPGIGIGFKTGDNVYTDYHYIIGTNQMVSPQGHRVSVRWYRPFPGNETKYNLVTGFTGFTGRFDPFGAGGQAVYGAKFFIGVSIKGNPVVTFKR